MKHKTGGNRTGEMAQVQHRRCKCGCVAHRGAAQVQGMWALGIKGGCAGAGMQVDAGTQDSDKRMRWLVHAFATKGSRVAKGRENWRGKCRRERGMMFDRGEGLANADCLPVIGFGGYRLLVISAHGVKTRASCYALIAGSLSWVCMWCGDNGDVGCVGSVLGVCGKQPAARRARRLRLGCGSRLTAS